MEIRDRCHLNAKENIVAAQQQQKATVRQQA